ncbi:hypothetical protein LWI28_023955 [Acer negundo]|uniref:Uncharacterized protein n=1 Tax=Acer negundo TaxID=4023 RepID=A0AAD5IAN8_ACENE|nr:hypothetical protein LWI28_023955 [Acer negundo]KAK4836760.1 hypothetical protein QYF36_027519 [Acer negundo]
MEKPNQDTIVLLLFFFLLITSHSSLSSARPLNHIVHHHHLPQSESGSIFRIALPSDHIHSMEDMMIKRSPCSDHHHHHAMESAADTRVLAYPKLTGKYGKLVLNVLPKGVVPPSAPGKGTNDVKN